MGTIEKIIYQIETMREVKKMTQRELAIKADIDQPYYNKIIKGGVKPAFEILELLAKAVGMEIQCTISLPNPAI